MQKESSMIVYDVKTQSRILQFLHYGWYTAVFTAWRDDLEEEENNYRSDKLSKALGRQGCIVIKQINSYRYGDLAPAPVRKGLSFFVREISFDTCMFIAKQRDLKAFLYSQKGGPYGLYHADTGTLMQEFKKNGEDIPLESYLLACQALLQANVEPDARLTNLTEFIPTYGSSTIRELDSSLWEKGSAPVKRNADDTIITINDVALSSVYYDLRQNRGFIVVPVSLEPLSVEEPNDPFSYGDQTKKMLQYVQSIKSVYFTTLKMGCKEKATESLYEMTMAFLTDEDYEVGKDILDHAGQHSFLLKEGGCFYTYGAKNDIPIKKSALFTPNFTPFEAFADAILSLVPQDLEFSYLKEYLKGGVNNAMIAHGVGTPMTQGWTILMKNET